jgi:hypothetical protein
MFDGGGNNVVITIIIIIKGEGKVHPCTGTEALYRPYSPKGE